MNPTDTLAPGEETIVQMRGELKELLGRTQGAREVLAHLAGVERALKALGANAFESLPTLVLKRAASQLESVLPQPCGPGIAELRARLGKAIAAIERTQATLAATPAAAASAAPSASGASGAAAAPAASAPANTATLQRAAVFSDAALQVSESTVTEFNRVLEASERKFS